MEAAALPHGGNMKLSGQATNAWRRACLASLLLAFTLGGCATYSSSFGEVEKNLASRQYDAALQGIEKQFGSRPDRVLYFLNKGMVLRMKRDFSASNRSLEAAKTEMERLYAASAGSHGVSSFLVSDARISYIGDDYEQALLHIYMALNYLELGQSDEARVEALQVDLKLRELSAKEPGSQLAEDAFSRYLTGMIYEERGELGDAMIAYRKACEAYRKSGGSYAPPMPTMLKHDLLRLARQQGQADEAARYENEFGIEPLHDTGSSSGQGELVFVLNNGLAPIKRENTSINSRPSYGPPLIVKLPIYESRRNNVVGARISVSGRQAATELVEDIDAVARASLNARMPAMVAHAMARSMIKQETSVFSFLSALFMQVSEMFTERADTRSWLTLPSNIQLARLPLAPGSYTVTVELLGADAGIVASSVYPDVAITRSRKTYLTQHWIPAELSATRRL